MAPFLLFCPEFFGDFSEQSGDRFSYYTQPFAETLQSWK